ncbi:hypothetical protein NEMBOFW57_009190 [Staphylotrichum longicolle]|uniref:Uncharacterized protein n=1 Tax=Staphylotrichum longicolle TaxID=669026 RepID=A0AAD4ESN6_9PEZI|nr:hypothetical protein NEMBOFW57_009190 [Staphylotrichum longicolle]
MASHPTSTWVEASQLLPPPAAGGSKAYPMQWQRQAHSDADTDVYRPDHDPSSSPGGPPAARQSTFLQGLSATWTFELLALLVSVAGLVAMVYVLRRNDGQRIPDWGSLSFNTLISILAVVSKMAALYGATSAISQLKWAWFTEHGKNLVDYKTFDSGSRGVAGAAMLAWTLKGRSIAVVGALAIIIGAAAGPFAQQIVHFYDDEYVDVNETAWIARADIVDSLGPKMDSTTWSLDAIFKANAITALFLPTQEALFQPRFSCPTGNCTWAPFSTLGFCSTCADLSSQLNRTCKTLTSSDNRTTAQSCRVAFPGGNEPLSLFYIADPDFPGSSTYMVLNSTRPANATVLKNVTWPQTVYQSIRAVVPPQQLGGTQNPYLEADGELANDGIHVLRADTRFIGSECALSPCVRRVQPSVARGEYREEVLDTFSASGGYRYGESLVLSPPWEDGKNFTIHSQWLEAVTTTPSYGGPDPLGGQLKGTVFTHDSNQAIRVSDIPAFGAVPRQNDALQAVFYAEFSNGTTCPTPDDNVACAFWALGAAMTKSVRDVAVSRNGTAAPYVAEGAVHTTGTYIRIEWPWLALPVAVWFLSLVTVVVAMWTSRGVPLWRDSALPLVLLTGEHADAAREVQEAALSARAETVKVHLAGDMGSGLKILTKSH